MNNLLDNEYLHNGTSIIYKELWSKIRMLPLDSQYIKPIGGFWTIPYYQNYSEWIDYLFYHKKEEYYEAIKNDNLLIKLNNNSKLLTISDSNDFKNLRDSKLTLKLNTPIHILNYFDYVNIYEIPDYEKISELYDAVYVKPCSDQSLLPYSVSTMLITNPNAIDYFKPIKIDYYEEDASIYSTVKSIGEPQKIQDLEENYIRLVEIIKNDLLKMITSNNKVCIDELETTLKNKYINNEDTMNLIRKDIDKLHAIRTIINNLMVDIKKEEKKLLKKLAH